MTETHELLDRTHQNREILKHHYVVLKVILRIVKSSFQNIKTTSYACYKTTVHYVNPHTHVYQVIPYDTSTLHNGETSSCNGKSILSLIC